MAGDWFGGVEVCLAARGHKVEVNVLGSVVVVIVAVAVAIVVVVIVVGGIRRRNVVVVDWFWSLTAGG